MTKNDFEKLIEERIKYLDNKQIIHFSWLCAVRALPFLGTKKPFEYWQEKDRQKHLFSIFNAIDIVFAVAYLPNNNAAYAPSFDADAAASFSAADAAYNARAASRAASRAAAAASLSIIGKRNTNAFYKTLLNDVEIIKAGNKAEFDNETSMYKGYWRNFLENLASVNCGYWAQLYKNLFESGFDLDIDELKRRLEVSDEIKAKGASAVGKYLDGLTALGDDVENINEARILILGEKGAGKTSLARRLIKIDAPMPKDWESTEGVITNIWALPKTSDHDSTKVHIWDFAGHSITHSAHRMFMSARCLYIYVYNGRIERDNDPRYWLEQIKIYGNGSPALFLINRKDKHQAEVEQKALKEEYPFILGFYDVDIGDNEQELESFIETVTNTVRNNLAWSSQKMSAYGYKTKEELQKRFKDDNCDYITLDEFKEITIKCGTPPDKVDWVLEELDVLGICSWHEDERLNSFQTLVLNHDWTIDGIYKIINIGREEKQNIHGHTLTLQDGEKILQKSEKYKYPIDKVEFLYNLMRRYDLAYFNSNKSICVPLILPLDQPEDLKHKKTIYRFESAESLRMTFEVDKFLPPNIIARVIVRRSANYDILDPDLLWRKGAILKHSKYSERAKNYLNTFALVQEESRRIIVYVSGLDKTVYISSLRETLQAIFEDYKGLKFDLKYHVYFTENTHPSSNKGVDLTHETIVSHVKNNQPYWVPSLNILCDLTKTAKDYGISI